VRPRGAVTLAILLAAAGATADPADSVFPPGWRQGWARSREGPKLSYHWGYPGFAPALLCRAVDPTWAIEWEGEPAPAVDPDQTVTYVWHVGLDSGTTPHRFELRLDGQPVVAFDTSGGTENRTWSVDGRNSARLHLLTTRIGSFGERFGFMALSLPRRLLGDGPPRFRVEPEAAGSQDYVLVFEQSVAEWAKVGAEHAVLRGGRRLITADVSHLGPTTPVNVRAAGQEVHRGALGTGHTRIEIGVPAGVGPSVPVRIEAAGRTLLEETVRLDAVTARTLHLVPHSHVDIGYSDPQPEVERKQWRNLRDAIALFEKTKDGPPEARFRWQTEGLWAVESFLDQASAAERKAFVAAVKRGDLELPANLTNVLTGLCHPEELARWTDAARRLNRRYGIETSPVAVHTDIPGLAWPTVTALAQAGVRFFSSGPNYMPNLKPDGGDRIGATLVEHGDRPFWWVSPSGRERLLTWVAGRGYSWFHGGNVGSVGDAATRGILDYARELDEREYPYEMVQVRYTVGGDNGPVDPNLPSFVAGWNERYETPRLVIDTLQGLFEAFERRYGTSLPEKRGDLTPYWEDGAISSAGEEIVARAAARRLVQAEALWAMTDPAGFPRDEMEEAWRQLLLWHEHTWGAAASISEPDRPDVVAQWEYKRAFALEADRRSRALFDQAAGRGLPAPGKSASLQVVNTGTERSGLEVVNTVGTERSGLEVVDTVGTERSGLEVVNTVGTDRSGLVIVNREQSRPGDRVTGSHGRMLPSQRLADGTLAVAMAKVAALGGERLRVSSGRAGSAAGSVAASGATLENAAIRVELDPKTGAIRRFLDRLRGTELAGPGGLARYRYVSGRDPAQAEDAGPVAITAEENGPLVAVLRAEGPAPGTSRLVTRYRLVAGSDRLEVEVVLDKLPVRAKESAHLTFDLAVERGRLRIDQGWNLMDPAKDALPGSCREFVGVHSALDASGPGGGVSLGVLDSPLVELGSLVDERPSPSGIRQWRPEPYAGTTVHAYLLNNYWHTNYKADQSGSLRFRFVLRPHGVERPGAITAFSRDLEQPLVVLPPAARSRGAVLAFEAGAGVQVVGVRPAGDGRAVLLRLLNASDERQEVRSENGRRTALAPWETFTLRVE
jgi:alpha-mannosidase